MCGIFGIAGFGAPADPSGDARMAAMERALAHRGPDGVGRAAVRGAALGSTRLRIVGEGERGRQPIANESGTILIAANGEIFDHAEHRAALEGRGHRFRGDSDVEVLLHLYEEEGTGAFSRVNGMFAVAIADAERARLVLARDRFGEKPLHLARGGGGSILFASEIWAIVAAMPARPAPDREALEEYRTFQSVGGTRTLFSGIGKVRPGGVVVADLDTGRTSAFPWAEPLAPSDGSPRAFRLALERSVRRRTDGLARFGVALSGGIDSSAVAAIAASGGNARRAVFFTGFSAGEGPGFDERPFAREVARAAGAPLVEVAIDGDRFAGALRPAIRALGEPMAGPGAVAQLLVARAAAAEGLRVLLNGEGADEILGGYARILLAWQKERGDRPDASRLGDYRPLETIFSLAPTAEAGYLRSIARDPDAPAAAEADRAIRSGGGSLVERLLRFETERLLPALLAVDDRVTMACGVESRAPFLDREVAAAARGVPPGDRFAHGTLKAPLRAALEGALPEAIASRGDKMGFPVPLGRWLRGPLARDLAVAFEACADMGFAAGARPSPGAEPFSPGEARRLWGVLSIGVWCGIA